MSIMEAIAKATQGEAEALTRATTGRSLSNYALIIEGFIAKGIPQDDIKPRENVFTFAAWKALGRYIRKGEHGVRIYTFERGQVKEEVKDPETGEIDIKIRNYSRPKATTVFHISQTEEE